MVVLSLAFLVPQLNVRALDNTDTDGDGIIDFYDRDDDNDGILDFNEECSGYIAQNTTGAWKGDTSSNATITYTPAINFIAGAWPVNTSQHKLHIDDGVGGAEQWGRLNQDVTLEVTFNTPVPASEIGFMVMDIDTANTNPNSTWTVEVNGTQDTTGIFQKQEMDVTYATNDDDVVFSNGVISAPVAKNDQYALITGSDSTMVSSLRITGANISGSGDLIGYSLFAYKSCDTDGDGVADKLDLDSDNDGCIDAIEGDGTFTNADVSSGALTGGVDANGVPTQAGASGQGVGTSKDATQQSDECDACNPSSTLFTDADGDGIGDRCDKDDDNDGILDVTECSAEFPVWTQNGNQLNSTVDGNNVTVTRTGTVGNAFVITMNATTVGYTGFQGLNETAANALGNTTMAVSIAQTQTTFTYNFDNPTTKDVYLHVFAFGNGTSVEVSPGLTIDTWNNGIKQGNSIVSPVGSGANDAGLSALVPAGTTSFTYTITATGSFGDGHFAFLTSNCIDTDSDGTPDKLDLDSDNDGCFDAIEGDGSFTATDLQNATGVTTGSGSPATGNMNLGNTVDTDGIPNPASPAGQDNGTSKDNTQKDADCCSLSTTEDSASGTVGTAFTIPNVLANDTVNGVAPTIGTGLEQVSLSQSGAWEPGITLDPNTGEVNVANSVSAGNYTVEYQVCVNGTVPQLCTTESVEITVTDAPIVANTDSGSISTTGGEAIANVLANDTLNGSPATTSNVTLSQVSTSNPGVTLDPATGAVNVAAGTPAGTYTVEYQICETANPTNCETTTATVEVTGQANVFDPPSARKTVSGGAPEMEWKMVWINDGNITALNTQVLDNIPTGTTYVANSLVCDARGASTTDVCTYDQTENRVRWEGNIAPDPGGTDENNSANEVVITFKTTVPAEVDQVENQAEAYYDRDGDGDFQNDKDAGLAPVLTDNSNASNSTIDPTIWRRYSLADTGTPIAMAIALGAVMVVGGGIALKLRKS